MLKLTRHTLNKIESIFEAASYQIRYERGSFQSGYCIVEHRNVIVINRFFDVEGRINALIDILGKLDLNLSFLDEKQAEFYKLVMSRQNIEA